MQVFVGRAREAAALRRRLAAEPLTFVLGRAGIGKTSTLQRALGSDVAVWHSVRPGDDVAQTALSLLRGLAPRAALPAVLGDPAQLIDDAVGAAEDARAVVVVDDAHHLGDGDADALLSRVARSAKHARWFVAARLLPPQPERVEDVIALGDLPRAALRRIAAALDHRLSTERIAGLVDAAQGSPWLLRKLLWQRMEGQPTFDELVAAMPAASASVLSLLSALDLPIDRATLLSAVRKLRLPANLPGVESAVGRVRAHDLVRELAGAPAISPARLASAARSTGDAAALLEAARLRLKRREIPQAIALLERELDRVVEAGFAPRLWSLVAGEYDECAIELRTRVALEIGSGPPLLAVLSAPPAPSTRGATLHAEALLTAGRSAEARERLLAVVEAPDAGFDAARLLARASLQLGELAEAQRICDRATCLGAAERAQHRALRMRILTARGELAGALAIAEELDPITIRLPVRARRDVEHALMSTFSACGRFPRVDAVARRLYRGAAHGATVVEAQGALASLSMVAIERGDLVEGRRLLARLAAPAEGIGYLRFFVRMNTVRIRMIEGDLEGAEREAEEVIAAAQLARNRGEARWGRVALAMMAWLRGSEPPVEEELAVADAQGRFLAAFTALRHLHRGEPAAPIEVASDTANALDARIFELLAAGTAALLGRDLARAEAAAREAIALGETSGCLVHGLEARLFLVDVLTVAGRRGAARSALAAIAAGARRTASRRLPLEVALAQALLDDDAPEASTLEGIARSEATAPRAARRARALLGDGRAPDVVDRVVLGASPWTRRFSTPYPGESITAASWGLDVARKRFWFSDGSTKRLPTGALHAAILGSLAQRGGFASKEELAKDVWGVRDYHPLHDDNRIQVGMFRLRKLVERDPRHPERIVVRGDGYALAGAEPVRLLEPVA